jgi:hypothetical protein
MIPVRDPRIKKAPDTESATPLTRKIFTPCGQDFFLFEKEFLAMSEHNITVTKIKKI